MTQKTDSAEVDAGLLTERSQVRGPIFAIFCIQQKVFPPMVHRLTTGGHSKSCGCHLGGPLMGLQHGNMQANFVLQNLEYSGRLHGSIL